MAGHKPSAFANWREFLKEYAIIVIGVLTALLAEQAVQSFAWRQKVNAAIDDMRQELSVANGPQGYARLAMHACFASRLESVRRAVEQGDRPASRKLIGAMWLPLSRDQATS